MDGDRMARAAAFSALLLGIVTLVTSAKALAGSDSADPLQLQLFNAAMGAAAVVVGWLAWKAPNVGVHGAAIVCALHLAALGALLFAHTPDGPIVESSVQAMMFRSLVWLGLFFMLAAANRRRRSAPSS